MEIYPNPGYGLFRVRILAPDRVVANIAVFNNLGKCLHILPVIQLQEGWQEHEIDLSEMPGGVYNISLNSGLGSANCQVVILK